MHPPSTAAAETGSGKTAAFALPVLQVVHETLVEEAASAARLARQASGGGVLPSAAVALSTADRDPLMAVSPDGLVCQCRSERSWAGVRASVGVTSGRHWFECLVQDDGLVRVGWSSAAAALELGTDSHGFGFGGAGMKSHGNAFTAYGTRFGAGHSVGCFLDADAEIVAADLASTPVARTARHPGPGATAAVVALLPASSSMDRKTHTLLLAVVGDARAAVAGPDGALLAVTCDQTPSVAEEAARVVAMGGTVTTAHIWGNKPRVAGVLAISRAFGNAGMKPYVTAEPVILRVAVPPGGCTCLLASDGLFDVLPTEEAVATACRPRERHPAGAVLQRARHLPEALDNITVVTLKLGPSPPPAEEPPNPGAWPAPAGAGNEALELFATPPTQPGMATQEGGAGPVVAPQQQPPIEAATCSAYAIGSKRKLDDLVGAATSDPRVACLVEPAG